MNVHADADAVVHHGDCLDALAALPAASIDAVVTDPPYGISFMGHDWDQPGQGSVRRGPRAAALAAGTIGADHTATTERSPSMHTGRYDLSTTAMHAFQAWCAAWAAECLRVLKPGGHLLSFGGARTWHRLTAGVEDAGFEVRDSIAWLSSKTFAKSHNLRGDWEGWGTGLKPVFEPCIVARAPFRGTVAANVELHGTGALHIDAARIPMSDSDRAAINGMGGFGAAGNVPRRDVATMGSIERTGARAHQLGRWPANAIADEDAAAELDAQSGISSSSVSISRAGSTLGNGVTHGRFISTEDRTTGYGDTGGASRFLYVAKASRTERVIGPDGTAHPTVKPLSLMRHLVRLVTPPGGIVLDPFAGSGTTLEATLLEGFRGIAIERQEDYLPLILQRIERARG